MTDPRPSLWTRRRHLAGFILIGAVAVVMLAAVVIAIPQSGDIPEADMAPDPVFTATVRNFYWAGPPGHLIVNSATDCLNVDRWDRRRWRQFIAYKALATDGWVPADEAAAARAAHPMGEFCTMGATLGLGMEMPTTAEPGIYRWCGLDYQKCYVFEYLWVGP